MQVFLTKNDLDQTFCAQVRGHVSSMWAKQKRLINAIVGCSVVAEGEEEGGGGGAVPVVRGHTQEISPTDVFFLDVVPVPPSRFRPVSLSVACNHAVGYREGWDLCNYRLGGLH